MNAVLGLIQSAAVPFICASTGARSCGCRSGQITCGSTGSSRCRAHHPDRRVGSAQTIHAAAAAATRGAADQLGGQGTCLVLGDIIQAGAQSNIIM